MDNKKSPEAGNGEAGIGSMTKEVSKQAVCK